MSYLESEHPMLYRSLLLSFIIPPILSSMVSCARAPETPNTSTPVTSVESLSNKSLTELSAQRIELLRELETISAREEELQSLIGAVQVQDPSERQQREQLRTELRELQEREAEIKLLLENTVTAQSQVTSQSTNNVLQKQELESLQLQIDLTQTELSRLMDQRNQLRAQVIAGGTTLDSPNASIFQNEIREVNTQISAKIDELEGLSQQLNLLVNNVSSQGTENSGASQSALSAEAARLQASISSKEAEILELDRRIKALLSQTDTVAVDQQEAYEAERAKLIAEVAEDKENLARIQAQLN